MPEINLLPWREHRREQQKRDFLIMLGVTIGVALVIIVAAWLAMNFAIERQEARNRFLQTNISSLDKKVREIKGIQQKRSQMLDRMRVIQDLQGNRPVIVRIFDEAVRVMPDSVFFNEMERKGTTIKVDGTAKSNNRVASLMRKLDGSQWFKSPNLTKVESNPGYGDQANNFTLSFKLESKESEQQTPANTSAKGKPKGKSKAKAKGA